MSFEPFERAFRSALFGAARAAFHQPIIAAAMREHENSNHHYKHDMITKQVLKPARAFFAIGTIYA
jgi:hypothetical protein